MGMPKLLDVMQNGRPMNPAEATKFQGIPNLPRLPVNGVSEGLAAVGNPELTALEMPQLLKSMGDKNAPYTLAPGASRVVGGKVVLTAPKDAPSGFQYAPDGTTLLPIKGGPADPAYIKQNAQNRRTVIVNNPIAGGDGNIIPATDPIVQSWVGNVINGNATMRQVPARYRNSVSVALQGAGKESFSPLASSRLTMAANRIVDNYIKLPQYQLTANGLPYLQRIEAALQTPGSVSDQDLLDSLTKLNTAGNAVTDAQVKLITDGKSWSDWLGTTENKFANGGVLSDNQRRQIKEIAHHIYENYRKGYQPVYDQAVKQLEDAGIPKAFWTIPDLNTINAGQADILSDRSQLKSDAAVHVSNDADYAKLPSGTVFIGPDGKRRRKP
jgi:hypothetical protein